MTLKLAGILLGCGRLGVGIHPRNSGEAHHSGGEAQRSSKGCTEKASSRLCFIYRSKGVAVSIIINYWNSSHTNVVYIEA